MAAFASAIRTNSDSYNFWGMVNSERDVQQRYYTWKALVSLTLLFFFSQRLPFPDGAKSTWHNCSSVSGFSLEVFASNQPSQASSWNWQARNSQGRDWKRDSQSTGSKLTAAEWKTGGGEGRARAFQLQRSGDLGSSWRHLSCTASFRSPRGRDAHTFRWVLPLGLPSRAPGFWLLPSDWMPKEEWAHFRNCSKVLRRLPSTRWDSKAKSRDQCYGRKIRRLVFFVWLVGFFFPDCYLQVGFLGASLLKQIIHRDQRAGDYAFESECIFLVHRNSHAAELSW